jgi:hypothetical protein
LDLARILRLERRDRLQVAIVINQLATPGLGSWIAGHRLAGAGQLVLACAGFVMSMGFCGLLLVDAWRSAWDGRDPIPPGDFWWQAGLGLFGLAWVWSGVTSLQIWRELRHRRRAGHPPRA